MASKKARPASFCQQSEPDSGSEIVPLDPFAHPTAELDVVGGRLQAIQAERDLVRRRRLARGQAERREAQRHARAERQRRRLARAERRAREEQAARSTRRAREENALRHRRRAVAPHQQGAPDRARAKTPPVVAEESQHGILNRQEELVLPRRGQRRGLEENGRVGELIGQQVAPIQANDPGLSYLVI